jgi:DNA repair exonuclease SbcCD ATPase subunit
MHNLETYRKLDGVRQGLVGELSATQKTLDRAQDRLKVYLDRKAKIEPTLRFREVLQLSEKALVKDALPKLLSAQYMGKLNERIQFYLRMINAEFTAHINADLEFMAKKSDGLVHKANRLSGGQKQQASVCYLLAVNDVFASTLGVLALDEPSGAMQESNSQDLAEAFNYLANLGQRTGRQFIVITHSAALAEYGCKQIRLEPSK